MIICICHRVSDRDIAGQVRGGCASFAELQDDTRVATGCGACLGHAQAAFEAQACLSRCSAAANPVARAPAAAHA
jgi:bacterioferritin-associated ferredoxin